MSADLITARVLLEVAGELALRAANIASAVAVSEDAKDEAERYEKVGDQVSELINAL